MLCGGVWAQDEVKRQRDALQDLIEKAYGGDAKALYDLAYLHDIGYDSIPVDSLRSTLLYLQSAEKGYPPAMNFLGFRYYTGEAINKNIDSAIYWIRKAADSGDITAAANLGYLLTESDEIPHDYIEASKWLTIAVQEGVTDAQLKLLDIKKEEWLNLTPDSALVLGAKYYTGKAPIIGTEILQTASLGGIPKADALLGDAYSKGIGVPYDHQKAIDHFLKAAKGGDPSAQFVIGELLEIFPDALNNQPGMENTDMIFPDYWLNKAAENGVTDSESAYQHLITIP